METIDLQYNDCTEILDLNYIIFFFRYLHNIQIKKNAIEYIISVYTTTYLCKQTFSKVKCIKSKYKSAIFDKHLKSILKIGTNNILLQFLITY